MPRLNPCTFKNWWSFLIKGLSSLSRSHLLNGTRGCQSRGLDPASVSNFFRAQIEANELVQYSLFAEWYREGRAPDHTPVDLAGTTRPELDEVDEALIVELAQSKVIRGSASCRTDIAKAPQRCGEPSSLLQMVGWFL